MPAQRARDLFRSGRLRLALTNVRQLDKLVITLPQHRALPKHETHQNWGGLIYLFNVSRALALVRLRTPITSTPAHRQEMTE